jgi:hypothetical protein
MQNRGKVTFTIGMMVVYTESMMMNYTNLSQHPGMFWKCTGLTVDQFDMLFNDMEPMLVQAQEARLSRPERQRAIGAGHPFRLVARDHLLLAVIWLRLYPVHEVLGYLFGVSDSTVSRILDRILPLLEQAGRDTMRLPDPGKKRRRHLSTLLAEMPELLAVMDSFEQYPPPDHSYFSGKQNNSHLLNGLSGGVGSAGNPGVLSGAEF